MLTENYYSLRKAMFCGTDSTNDSGNPFYGNWPIISTDGASRHGANMQYCARSDFGFWLNKGICGAIPTTKQTYNNTEPFGVYFGSGSTPATRADITLESPITSGLSISNTSKLFQVEEKADDNYVCYGSYVLKNTTDADIIIREIGVITPIGLSSSAYYPTLMERTVLTEPITIPAGGVKMIVLSVDLNMTLSLEAQNA